MKYLSILCTLICALMARSTGQQQSVLATNASVRVSVSENGDVLLFSYTVTASDASARIDTVKIDITTSPTDAQLAATGLNNDASYSASLSSAAIRQGARVTPVGMSSPSGWRSNLTVDSAAAWHARMIDTGVSPASTVTGFTLESYGLPAPRAFTAEPYIAASDLQIPIPTGPSGLSDYLQALDAIKQSNIIRGTTIGPKAPPANFGAADFLAQIISYRKSAAELGWITSSGILNSLDAKLNAAGAALSRGDAANAANILDAFVNEVSAQDGKAISSEAAALLKYNALYLIKQLRS
jgi:hypothetical protein